jgi:hypothetical protein
VTLCSEDNFTGEPIGKLNRNRLSVRVPLVYVVVVSAGFAIFSCVEMTFLKSAGALTNPIIESKWTT